MNYVSIHTNIAPNYNYLAAENAYLKQNLEYKDAVICEQQSRITNLEKDVSQLSQASTTYKQERDKFEADAQRWKVMQRIIKMQSSEREAYEVHKIVDREIEREYTGRGSLGTGHSRST